MTGQYRYVRVSVSNVINDHNGSAAAWAAGLVEVQVYNRPVAQTINFGDLPDRTYGDPDFAVSATSSSGLPVTFTAAGDCTSDANSVHLTGAGACTVTASQAGDESFTPATDVARRFTIVKAAQTIGFEVLPDMIVGSADFKAQADASSGLPVTFSASGVCTIIGASVHLSGPGTCAVTASQPGNANYAAASDVARTFNVTYGIVVLSDLSTAVQRGDTLALTLKLTDAAGTNLSSSTVTVHAVGIDGTQVAPAPGNSQPGQNFRFISASSSYQYNIKTSGMALGKHSLAYTAGLDPTIHTVSFTVRN